MEFFTILLSGLLALISPLGLVVDRTSENAIRSRFNKVEKLQVRVDNSPSYQILQGKLQRVRLAGRGLWVTPEFRIDVFELETDPIALNLQRLTQTQKNSQNAPSQSIKEVINSVSTQPLQAGVHLVLTQKDINQALRSPAIVNKLQQMAANILTAPGEPKSQQYEFVNPQVEFIGNNRLRLSAEVKEPGQTEKMPVIVESGLAIEAGHQIRLISPSVSINGNPLPPTLIAFFIGGINNQLSLRTLEDAGIIARVLKLNIDSDRIDLAAFVRLGTSKTAIGN